MPRLACPLCRFRPTSGVKELQNHLWCARFLIVFFSRVSDVNVIFRACSSKQHLEREERYLSMAFDTD
jgi:hypothetical protein